MIVLYRAEQSRAEIVLSSACVLCSGNMPCLQLVAAPLLTCSLTLAGRQALDTVHQTENTYTVQHVACYRLLQSTKARRLDGQDKATA